MRKITSEKFVKKHEQNGHPHVWAFDFDDTIGINQQYPYPAGVLHGARHTINFVHDEIGDFTLGWTCRAGDDLEIAKQFCIDEDIHIDGWNEHAPFFKETFGDSRKIFAHHYVDDRAVPHDFTWGKVLEFAITRYEQKFGKPYGRTVA